MFIGKSSNVCNVPDCLNRLFYSPLPRQVGSFWRQIQILKLICGRYFFFATVGLWVLVFVHSVFHFVLWYLLCFYCPGRLFSALVRRVFCTCRVYFPLAFPYVGMVCVKQVLWSCFCEERLKGSTFCFVCATFHVFIYLFIFSMWLLFLAITFFRFFFIIVHLFVRSRNHPSSLFLLFILYHFSFPSCNSSSYPITVSLIYSSNESLF